MIKFYKFLFISIALLFTISSCDNEEELNGTPPELEALNTEIIAAPGDEIRFEGTLADENGITEIRLVNEELLLNKNIIFAQPAKKYYLDYKFSIAENVSEKVFDVTLEVKNRADLTENWTIAVDVATSPTITGVPASINASPGGDISITGSIADNNGIETVTITGTSLSINESLDVNDAPNAYDLNYNYSIPSEAERTVHKIVLSVTSVLNRTTEQTIDLNLTGEEVTYENVYAAGGFQWVPWNPSLAYEMDQDPDNEGWFYTELPSWDGGFDEVKFLGQTDWAPNNWGLVDASDPSLGMVNDENSAAIVMPANGKNPAYYSVRFNPYELSYQIEEITEAKTPRDEMYIVGKGFPDYPNLDWNFEEAIPMTKNPYGFGEHLFLVEGLNFSDAVELKFLGQNTGWGPYDAGFVEGGETQAPVRWAQIEVGDGTADVKINDQAGTYSVLFDAYLERALIWQE
ncbi:MAG TPA: hypothetical protein DDY13_12640 [Cytophagales bacterium]|jgi:hypothetical protein|nr:hypothetical protein [Cytophagales bacterium]